MKILLNYQSMISIGIVSKIMMFLLLDAIIGKKEKRKGMALICLLHFLIYNVGVLIIMDSFYRETLWFRLLMPTCNLVLALVIVFLFASLTGTNYFRMLLEAVAVDAVCGIIVHIDRKLFSDPIMIFIALLAVLREFVLSCYRRKIQVEVLFHEYQRKQIKPEDTAAVLSRMLDYILMGQESISAKGNEGEDHEGGTVKVQGAFVKNQLILSARLIPAEGAAVSILKIRKRDFNPWLKKYNGLIYVMRKCDILQIVVGMDAC